MPKLKSLISTPISTFINSSWADIEHLIFDHVIMIMNFKLLYLIKKLYMHSKERMCLKST
ncbi:hypothetical protein BpHYR1_004035 [Brachionus plicatilis]|uniref:Uncharacterized protein n=1 Tax=Brachionus plicatilis TaxID=10195 RepID=A0A3M7T301_BRAPC|nr:hypothetical protein BpHYR1_004035 [Brachionus plicatilis]